MRYVTWSGPVSSAVFPRGRALPPREADATVTLSLGELAGGAISARLQNSSLGAQHAAIRAGLCLGVLPVFVARATSGPDAGIPAEIVLTRSYWMSVSEDDSDNPRVQRVCDTPRDSFAASGGVFMAEP